LSTPQTDMAPAAQPLNPIIRFNPNDRRHFIGGSDARIIMGADQEALTRLWYEKRGEAEPEDLSDNLIVQLGTVTDGTVDLLAWAKTSLPIKTPFKKSMPDQSRRLTRKDWNRRRIPSKL
jgi:hypothetical protein